MNSTKDKLIPRGNIKFLSYNISLYSPVSSISNPLYEEIRLQHFYKELPKYDIISLQSISSTFSKHKINLIQEAQKKGFYFYSTSNPSTNTFSSYSMESGLIILSRFPIEKQCYIPYEYGGSYIDTLREKGFLYSKIKIKDYALHIITTALQSNEYSSSSKVLLNDLLRECSDIRKEQIKEMFTFIKEGIVDNKEIYNKSDLIILCGNFNIEQKISIPVFLISLTLLNTVFHTRIHKIGGIGILLNIFLKKIKKFGGEEYYYMLFPLY